MKRGHGLDINDGPQSEKESKSTLEPFVLMCSTDMDIPERFVRFTLSGSTTPISSVVGLDHAVKLFGLVDAAVAGKDSSRVIDISLDRNLMGHPRDISAFVSFITRVNDALHNNVTRCPTSDAFRQQRDNPSVCPTVDWSDLTSEIQMCVYLEIKGEYLKTLMNFVWSIIADFETHIHNATNMAYIRALQAVLRFTRTIPTGKKTRFVEFLAKLTGTEYELFENMNLVRNLAPQVVVATKTYNKKKIKELQASLALFERNEPRANDHYHYHDHYCPTSPENIN